MPVATTGDADVSGDMRSSVSRLHSFWLRTQLKGLNAARQGMRACNNNNMRNPSLHLFYYGVTHVIIVACPHPLSCCIYTALVSLLFGTVIPTSFNILMEMFLLPLYVVYGVRGLNMLLGWVNPFLFFRSLCYISASVLLHTYIFMSSTPFHPMYPSYCHD